MCILRQSMWNGTQAYMRQHRLMCSGTFLRKRACSGTGQQALCGQLACDGVGIARRDARTNLSTAADPGQRRSCAQAPTAVPRPNGDQQHTAAALTTPRSAPPHGCAGSCGAGNGWTPPTPRLQCLPPPPGSLLPPPTGWSAASGQSRGRSWGRHGGGQAAGVRPRGGWGGGWGSC